MTDETKVVVRWRRDDIADGIISWGQLLAELPDLAAGRAIVAAGYLYEHRDGTTVALCEDEASHG